MRKLIQLNEKTHKYLKLYVVSNDLSSFDAGISELLSISNNELKKEKT